MMGYTTRFEGKFKFSQPLTLEQYQKLAAIADQDQRDPGPGKVEGYDFSKFDGYFCQWEPSKDGKTLAWNQGEKFYDFIPWLRVLIEKYLKPWGIELTGKVRFQGEEMSDHGYITISGGVVKATGPRRDQ